MAVALGAVALAGVLPTGPLGAQRCREPHYRWTQKVDTSLATLAPQPASTVAILGTWEPPHLGAQDRCAPRAGRELQVDRLTGWVRRVGKAEEDGRCNTSVRALWEIHPVYEVTRP